MLFLADRAFGELNSTAAIMASNIVSETSGQKNVQSSGPDALSVKEKREMSSDKQTEDTDSSDGNLHYGEVDEEPELHITTYIALVSMFLLNMVQVLALQGPPAVVSVQT